ncbi:2-oxoglutarate dehydrogenase complex dihydrolipoyllysine-residue succinyltransferase [Pectobacterium aroidearum]|uniref:2-oxoglutarate dehydrogenase complex dihydrolipoyllysine-residue succinyltransferase n=1 Tax=Pectobacterium aroidearum TaxID=1201031 RepID=UPI001CD67599|nr:2-oxoglutarate dehydrogenase complex dihydrolipoyllysine-residue succinyltransferase [Pectobacterium aroidearum]
MIEVNVPQLPESVTEATLLEWRKAPGEYVNRDDVLVEIETDKVILEIPAPESGVLKDVLFDSGATVTGNQLLAKIDTQAQAQAQAQTTVTAPESASLSATEVLAMPSARHQAAERNIDLASVEGSGRGGRILKQDLPSEAPLAPFQKANVEPQPMALTNKDRLQKRVPMSRLRQRIAQRLLESQSQNAILTTFNEVNMQPVMDLRNRYKEQFQEEYGVKLGFMGFFVKAVVHALKKYPVLNASVEGSDIVYNGYFDIGVAVGSPRGLVVPIIRDADQLSLADIEKQIADFGRRAQEGKLEMSELTGGTYTISNGGTFGSMMSTPIINPPQSAILGMHATKKRPVEENNQIVLRPMMYLAQSYDHRIIDGREAVLSLVAIKEAIEDPSRLLLGL